MKDRNHRANILSKIDLPSRKILRIIERLHKNYQFNLVFGSLGKWRLSLVIFRDARKARLPFGKTAERQPFAFRKISPDFPCLLETIWR